MALRIAINGFGRMGRLFFRSIWDQSNLEVVHINEPHGDVHTSAHLLEYDSVHGKFQNHQIKVISESEINNSNSQHSTNKHNIQIGKKTVSFSQNKTLQENNWQSIDLLVDCSGQYRKTHLFDSVFQQGVKKVLVSCPVKDAETLNIVYGVNDYLYQHEKNHLITAASCTTNCLAPVIQVLIDNFGIKQGSMTTIHDITNTQKIIDSHHKDLRRARSCAESLIPTSSGSTTAIMKIFPQLQDKLNGLAVRVPIVNASLVDLVVKTEKKTSVEAVNQAFKFASENNLKNILGYEIKPLVSVDYKDDKRSAIIDSLSTQVTQGDMVKVLAWYDNEINYVERMKDIANMIAKHY